MAAVRTPQRPGDEATARSCDLGPQASVTYVETSPTGDPFGAKVHRSDCRLGLRAKLRRRITEEEARTGVPCLRCLPKGIQ